MKNKDKNGKLSTYVVVMLLSIIIVIIIAAMADNREQDFQNRIETATQTNMTIQNEIVSLKDSNYALTQENTLLKEDAEANAEYIRIYTTLSAALDLDNQNLHKEAAEMLAEINPDLVPKELKALYDEVCDEIR